MTDLVGEGRLTALAMDLAGTASGSFELCRLLLLGESVPLERLDQEEVRRYGFASPPIDARVTLGNFNLVPRSSVEQNGRAWTSIGWSAFRDQVPAAQSWLVDGLLPA
ncbi:MAG TPA: hypothetical protein VFF43_07385, partial [Caldimonas sp.]|nr:hypothetical protein [Caldimonas sp.]